ncbi:MAG TPA: isocitrate lyase/PEP mutase family protein [Gaiellales bacterium]|nr:isocitrate lyase/PEP mutase family protein [Gaiellales bacterium]
MAGLLAARDGDGATGGARLRSLIATGELLVAPGCYDALGARLIEQAGFRAAYMTGFGSSAALLGRPDVGLLSMTEMVANAGRIVGAVDVPVIADADTGYGNPVNVIRTVHEYQRAGVAAIHLEDQVTPKRCGHTAGKQVVPEPEMSAKLRAAVAARGSGDLVIIARTDARAVEGFEAALERGRRYVDAGADMLFVEAPQSEHEVALVAQAFPGVPLVFNEVIGGRTPPVEPERLREWGFRLMLVPVATLLAATAAVRDLLERVRSAGTSRHLTPEHAFDEFLDLIGLAEVRAIERRFAPEQLTIDQGAST